MKKTLLHLIFPLFFTANLCAQNVNIPDANFKNALLQNVLINTNSDNEIQVSEATAYAGAIDVNNKSIKNLTGIEAFVMIKELNCGGNQLTTLDVSKNTALTEFYCYGNELTTLNVSKNTALIVFYCYGNELTTLDVSKNTALTELHCSINTLTTLDVSKNTALTVLDCTGNELTTLDVSKNTALAVLYCDNNKLMTLDVSKNTALTELHCDNNKLMTLDVSKNTALIVFYCYGNKLTTLDVSKNTALAVLHCDNNKLTTLNLKNGTNAKLKSFYSSFNPLLKCIQVDDPSKTGATWGKDATATYSAVCSSVSTEDAAIVENLLLYPNPATHTFQLGWQGETETLNMALFNSVGVLVKSQKIQNQGNVNIENLPRGLYFCRLSDDGHKTQTVKVIVE
jgi:hypothetical protein